MANKSFITPTQPSLKGGQIPTGHIILNSKYAGSQLCKELSQTSFKVILDDTIGLIDCYASAKCAVIIVQESNLIMDTVVKQKIRKLVKFPNGKVLIAEVTDTNKQYFYELQDNIVFNDEYSDIKLIPVSDLRELALVLTSMSGADNDTNPFLLKKKKRAQLDESILDVVHSFPGVGGKKALDLLTTFKSIKNILTANVSDLSKVVGRTAAESIIQMASEKK